MTRIKKRFFAAAVILVFSIGCVFFTIVVTMPILMPPFSGKLIDNTADDGIKTGSDKRRLNLCIEPSIIVHPVDNNVKEGEDAAFTVEIFGFYEPVYQWYVSFDDGAVWNNITGDTTYSGTTTDTLQLFNVPLRYNGFKYRCVVTNEAAAVFSNEAELKVKKDNDNGPSLDKNILPHIKITIIICLFLLVGAMELCFLRGDIKDRRMFKNKGANVINIL